jgi:hypothetical protein
MLSFAEDGSPFFVLIFGGVKNIPERMILGIMKET